jgi:hypothetical protein
MLAASVAFGIQKFLIAMSSDWPISLLLTFAAVAWAFSHLRHGRSAPWLSKLLQKFLAADYEASQQAVDRITGQVATLERPAASKTEAPGMFERIKEWVPKGADLTLYFENLKKSAEQSIEHMVKLMVIFLLETLLIPLLLLWGLYVLLRGAFDLRPLSADRGRLA